MAGSIHSGYVLAENPAELVPFYSELLGVPPAFNDENHWIQFPRETGRFAIGGPRETPEGASESVLVLKIDDASRLDAILANHGGEIINRRDMGDHGVTVTLRDPAGNLIQLFLPAGA